MEKQTVDIDFKHSIFCQRVKDEGLVENPNSYEKLVAAIKERASYGESRYSVVWSSLKLLLSEETTWHRQCYHDATHSGMLRRAKERYERELASPNESRRKSRYLQEPETIHQLTRSKDKPLQHSTVFFSVMVRKVIRKIEGSTNHKWRQITSWCH